MDVATQFVNALNNTGTLNVNFGKRFRRLASILLKENSVGDGIVIPANFSVNYFAGSPLI